jgi:hypothetical protein
VQSSVKEFFPVARPDAQSGLAYSDKIALGAIAGIEAAGRTGELIVCGVDAMPEALKAIRADRACRSMIRSWCCRWSACSTPRAPAAHANNSAQAVQLLGASFCIDHSGILTGSI